LSARRPPVGPRDDIEDDLAWRRDHDALRPERPRAAADPDVERERAPRTTSE
jgi:hypothetical protein